MALLANVKAPSVGTIVTEGFSGKCSACCQETTRILKKSFTAKWTPTLRATQKIFVPTQVGVGINQVQLIKPGNFCYQTELIVLADYYSALLHRNWEFSILSLLLYVSQRVTWFT